MHNLNQKRIKLKVIPKLAMQFDARGEFGPDLTCIEVINLSTFPVTVTEVGYALKGHPRKGKRATIPQPIVMDGKPWPRRLESRQSVTVYIDPKMIPPGIGKAYAFTDCMETAMGDSPALEQLRKKLLSGQV